MEQEEQINKEQTFHFSRHLLSCNNIIDKRYGTKIKDQIFSVRHKMGEPPLSLWGVLTGLLTRKDIKDDEEGIVTLNSANKRINRVYVSCLLRTWLTAILKYLPYSDSNKNFELVVSPYIKEYHAIPHFDSSNLPPNLVQTQLDKLYDFFEFFKQIKFSVEEEEEDEAKERHQRILDRLHTIKLIFPLYSLEFDLYPEKDVQTLSYYNNKGRTQSISITNKSSLSKSNSEFHYDEYVQTTIAAINSINNSEEDNNYPIPNRGDFGVQPATDSEFIGGKKRKTKKTMKTKKTKQKGGLSSFFGKKKTDIVTQTTFSKMSVTFNEIRTKPEYTKYYGDKGLIFFTDWVQNVINDKSNIIYVVAHSDIMQQFFLLLCNQIDRPNKYKSLKTIPQCLNKFLDGDIPHLVHTNMWDLIFTINERTPYTQQMTLTKFIIKKGEVAPSGDMILMEAERQGTCPKSSSGGKSKKRLFKKVMSKKKRNKK